MTRRPLAVVAGIGDGLGLSLATRFADAGYDILGLARSEHASSRAVAALGDADGVYSHRCCDLSDPEAVRLALQDRAGEADVMVYNAHRLFIGNLSATSAGEFEAVWRSSCLGAMVVAREIAPAMAARGNGTMIFSGATAAIRGNAGFAAFASAKFALRGLAQALAREFGPQGVHVCHVILDGLLDEPQSDLRFGPAKRMRMNPGTVAEVYLSLVRQHRSAWSQEMDLRPGTEPF